MTSENDSAAILLAAGAGVRFGRDKLGAAIKDEPVIAHSAKA